MLLSTTCTGYGMGRFTLTHIQDQGIDISSEFRYDLGTDINAEGMNKRFV